MSVYWRATARFLATIALLLSGWAVMPSTALAQDAARLPRVGVLYLTGAGVTVETTAFGLGMRELGYVPGRNVIIEWRDAGGRPDRLAALAAELVRAKVDVIVTGGPSPLAAVRAATTTIPIVTVSGSDPIVEGWARSLARPGGNVTGLSVTFPELVQKRLELLKDALPGMVRVAVVLAPGEMSGQAPLVVRQIEDAARQLALQVQVLEVREPADFERVIRQARDDRAQALLTLETSFVVANRLRLTELAARERLPVMGEFTAFGVDGVFMAYGADINDLLRRAATHVDRILKGARAGDLPIEQPSKLDLTVNLKVARALGITVPKSLLLRADRVVE